MRHVLSSIYFIPRESRTRSPCASQPLSPRAIDNKAPLLTDGVAASATGHPEDYYNTTVPLCNRRGDLSRGPFFRTGFFSRLPIVSVETDVGRRFDTAHPLRLSPLSLSLQPSAESLPEGDLIRLRSRGVPLTNHDCRG